MISIRDHALVRKSAVIAALCLGAIALVGCGDGPLWEYSYPEGTVSNSREASRYSGEKPDSTIFGSDGDLFGSILKDGGKNGVGGGVGIGVNSFLWRATLDTISFMPLASADPFGGVIITDWYSPPETPNERFKMNVYILDRQLRADGVRVAVFRQHQNGTGTWATASVKKETTINLENQILTRARQLRVASASAN